MALRTRLVAVLESCSGRLSLIWSDRAPGPQAPGTIARLDEVIKNPPEGAHLCETIYLSPLDFVTLRSTLHLPYTVTRINYQGHSIAISKTVLPREIRVTFSWR